MTPPSVRSATADEQARAIHVLVMAFGADPTIRWFYPDPFQYLSHFPEFVRLFGGDAFAHESAYVAGDF